MTMSRLPMRESGLLVRVSDLLGLSVRLDSDRELPVVRGDSTTE